MQGFHTTSYCQQEGNESEEVSENDETADSPVEFEKQQDVDVETSIKYMKSKGK